jgi:hypothetical protein
MRLIPYALAVILGVYLMARAVVEFFFIDVSDPSTYRDDWGGPSLLGVLAVHCGPGLVALAVFVFLAVRYARRRPSADPAAPGSVPRG